MGARYRRIIADATDANIASLSLASPRGLWERDDVVEAHFDADRELAELARETGGRIEDLPEEDWAESWKRRVRPVRVGRLFVTPPWLAGQARPGEIPLIVEPGMAFGTGDHETTRGCLALLQRRLRAGARVLDFGCGSGILAMAAMKLGASGAAAVDCDADAVRIARENAAINGVAIETSVASVPPAGRFDIVIANIQSSVLLPLLPSLRERVAPAGVLILSGLLAEEPFPAENVTARLVDGAWVTLEIESKP